MSLHVVVGGGVLGRATVGSLVEHGERVRLVSRSPRMEESSGVELVSADATNRDELGRAVAGATTVYNCANAPYDRWPEELPPIWNGITDAAADVGARLVVGTNLYSLGTPDGSMDARTPMDPSSRKGRVRAELEARALAADKRGDLRVALVRASDFYGPEVVQSVLGERFFGALLTGKPGQLYGNREVKHSYAFLPDFARTMAAVGTSSGERVWGRSWIAPHDRPVTVDELEEIAGRLVPGAQARTMGRLMLRLGGLFVPAARETIEMLYQFEEPFVVDARETVDMFDLAPTPLEDGFARTVSWYRERE